MLNTFIFKGMLIVCVIISNLDGLKGLPLCGDLGAAKVYSPDKMFCCNKRLLERVDEYKQERDCCSNTLYYTDVYDCVNGRLIKSNRPYPLSSAPNVPMEKEDIVGKVLTSLPLCGDLRAVEVYNPDEMVCCNKTLFERFDEYEQERDCCSNTLYYTDVYDCVNGRLIKSNRPYPLSSALNVPMGKNDIVRKVFTNLPFCGDLRAVEVYNPNEMVCCNKTLFERFDEYERERDCCSNTLYYTDVYDCVNGRLIKSNRPHPLSSALNVPMEKENIVGKVITNLPLCGDLRAAEVYNPDETVCCNKTLFERLDEYERERDCCSSTPYYADVYDCMDGMLINLSRPFPLSRTSKSPMEKEAIDGIVRSFYIAWETDMRPTTQTDNSGRELEDSA